MPIHDDPHAADYDATRLELLTLIALGEPVAEEFEEHRRTCPLCQEDLAAYRNTVVLVRAGRNDANDTPPADVWTRIADDLGLPASTAVLAAVPDAAPAVVLSHRRWIRWRLAAAAAAAVVVLGAGVGIGALVGRDDRAAAPAVVSQAVLVHPSGPALTGRGTARIHTSPAGLAITVTTAGLPIRTGYYQVWLYDPTGQRMVPVGTLNDDGTGTFTVPAGVDLRAYDIVDVSAQDYDGTFGHKQTVLQGPLTR